MGQSDVAVAARAFALLARLAVEALVVTRHLLGGGTDSCLWCAGLKQGMNLYASNPRRPHFRGYLTVLEVAADLGQSYCHLPVQPHPGRRFVEYALFQTAFSVKLRFLKSKPPPSMALQRSRCPRFSAGRSLRLDAEPLVGRPYPEVVMS